MGAVKANDDYLIDFLLASTGYHLRKGQFAEAILAFSKMLHCSDITQLSIAEYPLVLFAQQCKLSGWFTICLHSSYTGEYVNILKSFLQMSSVIGVDDGMDVISSEQNDKVTTISEGGTTKPQERELKKNWS